MNILNVSITRFEITAYFSTENDITVHFYKFCRHISWKSLINYYENMSKINQGM
jgi:hypothetical protein